jgi:hypothetical protein
VREEIVKDLMILCAVFNVSAMIAEYKVEQVVRLNDTHRILNNRHGVKVLID